MPTVHKAVIKALKEKRELERRIAEIDQFLRLYKEFSEESVSGGSSMGEPRESTQKRAPIGLSGPKSVVSVAKTILKHEGQPLTRGELAAELEARGVKLPGNTNESRARYVGTIMWRSKEEFENIEGKGYWLKDLPIPETEHQKRMLREGRELPSEFDLTDKLGP